MIDPIKKGDRFICIKDVVKNDARKQPKYFKGQEYQSDFDGCITNCEGNIYHMWHVNDHPEEFFHLLGPDKNEDQASTNTEIDMVVNNAIGSHKSFLMP